jgi:CheY-like chemotaxis protein
MAEAAKLRILLVEDESIVAMMVEDMLDDLGFAHAGTAGNLAEALKMSAELEIDGALLDVNLHGKPSFEAAEKLKARGVPVVFATGYGVQGLPEAWRHAPVLSKPFQKHELKAALDKALGL